MTSPDPSERARVQWERMFPEEFRKAQAALPIAFLPLGVVEWHGEHNALGLDSLKAHELCVRAALAADGGIVHPPHYGGMGGLDKPATVVIEGEFSWDNWLVRPWIEKLCDEFLRQGFKAIIMLTGHYGHAQQILVREAAVRMTERLQIPVLGLAEYWLAQDVGYLGDHAGIGETSLLWYLHPELVAIERIDADPDYGVDGVIRDGSSPELGQKYASIIIERLATMATQMPHWDETTREAFVRAEQALIRAQLKGWRSGQGAWTAWSRMFAGEEVDYGKLLVEGDFAGIEALAGRLLEA